MIQNDLWEVCVLFLKTCLNVVHCIYTNKNGSLLLIYFSLEEKMYLCLKLKES